jgi:hypothetical protein
VSGRAARTAARRSIVRAQVGEQRLHVLRDRVRREVVADAAPPACMASTARWTFGAMPGSAGSVGFEGEDMIEVSERTRAARSSAACCAIMPPIETPAC